MSTVVGDRRAGRARAGPRPLPRGPARRSVGSAPTCAPGPTGSPRPRARATAGSRSAGAATPPASARLAVAGLGDSRRAAAPLAGAGGRGARRLGRRAVVAAGRGGGPRPRGAGAASPPRRRGPRRRPRRRRRRRRPSGPPLEAARGSPRSDRRTEREALQRRVDALHARWVARSRACSAELDGAAPPAEGSWRGHVGPGLGPPPAARPAAGARAGLGGDHDRGARRRSPAPPPCLFPVGRPGHRPGVARARRVVRAHQHAAVDGGGRLRAGRGARGGRRGAGVATAAAGAVARGGPAARPGGRPPWTARPRASPPATRSWPCWGCAATARPPARWPGLDGAAVPVTVHDVARPWHVGDGGLSGRGLRRGRGGPRPTPGATATGPRPTTVPTGRRRPRPTTGTATTPAPAAGTAPGAPATARRSPHRRTGTAARRPQAPPRRPAAPPDSRRPRPDGRTVGAGPGRDAVRLRPSGQREHEHRVGGRGLGPARRLQADRDRVGPRHRGLQGHRLGARPRRTCRRTPPGRRSRSTPATSSPRAPRAARRAAAGPRPARRWRARRPRRPARPPAAAGVALSDDHVVGGQHPLDGGLLLADVAEPVGLHEPEGTGPERGRRRARWPPGRTGPADPAATSRAGAARVAGGPPARPGQRLVGAGCADRGDLGSSCRRPRRTVGERAAAAAWRGPGPGRPPASGRAGPRRWPWPAPPRSRGTTAGPPGRPRTRSRCSRTSARSCSSTASTA